MVLFLFHWSKREKSNCCSFLIKMHTFNTYPVAYPSFLCHARNGHCPSQTVGGCFQIYLYIHSCTNLSKYYLKSNLLKNMKWYRSSFVNSESSANVECFSCYYFYFDLNILVSTKKQNKTLDLIATATFLKEPNWVLFFLDILTFILLILQQQLHWNQTCGKSCVIHGTCWGGFLRG